MDRSICSSSFALMAAAPNPARDEVPRWSELTCWSLFDKDAAALKVTCRPVYQSTWKTELWFKKLLLAPERLWVIVIFVKHRWIDSDWDSSSKVESVPLKKITFQKKFLKDGETTLRTRQIIIYYL